MIRIQVVGPGCVNCQRLAALCQEVVSETGVAAEIEKVTEFERFTELGIMLTPALIIDGVVKSAGKIPVKSTLAHWIADAAAVRT